MSTEFVVNTKKVLWYAMWMILVAIPLNCAGVYLVYALSNSSKHTVQIGTYWAPHDCEVHLMREWPEGSKAFINYFDSFKVVAAEKHILIYVGGQEVRYLFRSGNAFVGTEAQPYEGLNDTGMSGKSFRPLEAGRVEFTYQRSVVMMAIGIVFSIFGGMVLDVALALACVGLWFLVIRRIWGFTCGLSANCSEFNRIWESTCMP